MKTKLFLIIMFFVIQIFSIQGQTILFEEDFESYDATTSLNETGTNQWIQDNTGTQNNWAVGDNSGSISGDRSLTIYGDNAYYSYNNDTQTERVAYYSEKINATDYASLTISFNWYCAGEISWGTDYDYGTLVWSTDGNTWTEVTSDHYLDETNKQQVTDLDLSDADGTEFYIGFKWDNDYTLGDNPPFTIDDIVIQGSEPPTAIWEDNFDGTDNWTMAGDFEFGEPQNGNTVTSAHTGTNILGTNLDGNYNKNRAENSCYAISDVIDCSNFSDVEFNYWSYTIFNDRDRNDFGKVYIINETLTNWQLLETINRQNDEDGWTKHTIDISDYADGYAEVKIKYTLYSDNRRQATGWNIDDISIVGTLLTKPYYSVASGNANTLINWEDEDGNNPVDFISDNQSFVITDGYTITTNAGWTISGSASSVEVESGGTLVVQNTINGDGGFTLQPGATLQITDAAGITADGSSGSIQVSGSISYSEEANYVYSGSAAQVTGDGLPDEVNGLTINNSSGVTLANSVTINGELNLQDGELNFSGNDLTINGTGTGSGSITGSSVSNLSITGSGDITVNFTNSSEELSSLTINRDGEVDISTDLTVETLALNNGVINNPSNTIIITSTATGAVTTANDSYINGALQRALANNGDYNFPVGGDIDDCGYHLFTLTNITGASSPVVKVTFSCSGATTADGETLASVTGINWETELVSGSLTDATIILYGSEITYSHSLGVTTDAQSGTYIQNAGTPGSGSISTDNAELAAIGSSKWFAIGTPVVQTYYSYQNGNWNNGSVWTLDPSGTTWYNNAGTYPVDGDDAYILNGRTITATTAVAANLLEMEYGGILDLADQDGSFSTLSGQGLLQLKRATFPTITTDEFNIADGGTVEYYATSDIELEQLTYNNLIINTNSAITYITDDITCYENLTVEDGTFQINNNWNTNALSVEIDGNVLVGSDGTITLGTGNLGETEEGAHDLIIGGDLINNGTVYFTGLTAPNYTNYPRYKVFVTFNNDTEDQYVTCNGTTNFYRIICDKGDDKTYILNIDAEQTSYFNLFGRNNTGEATGSESSFINHNALDIYAGTLRLGENIELASLSESETYYIDEDACLWIDGADVTFSTSESVTLVVYGDIKVSGDNSVFTNNGAQGFVMRDKSAFYMLGGTVTGKCFRTSYTESTHRGTFSMSGGKMTLSGETGDISGMKLYGTFILPYPENSFEMTGGILELTSVTSGSDPRYSSAEEFSLILGCNSENISMTSGEIIINIPNNRDSYIASYGSFWDLTIVGTNGNYIAKLEDYEGYTDASPYIPALDAQPLVVKNDFILESSAEFDANDKNVTVGGNFIINSETEYVPGSNTTTFNGTEGQEFQLNGTIANDHLNNFTLTNSTATVLTGDNNLNVNGIWTIDEYCSIEDNSKTITANSTIYNAGTHVSDGDGKVIMYGEEIQGNGDGIFGNLEINRQQGVTMSATQTITGILTLTDGVLDIGTNGLNLYNTASDAVKGTFSASEMIETAGNKSDGGILKLFSEEGNTFIYPVGTNGTYSPATVSVTASEYGNITVVLVDEVHPYVTDASKALKKYWKLESEYFQSITGIQTSFVYEDSDPKGTENNYYAAYYTPYEYTTSNSSPNYVDTDNNTIYCSFTDIDADYTAGEEDAFSIVTVYYSRQDGNWEDEDTWSNTEVGGVIGSGIPQSYNPVIIGDATTNDHSVTVTGAVQSGSLQLNSGSVLDVGIYTTSDFGVMEDHEIEGTGTIRISSNNPNCGFPDGDFGNFLGENGGTVEYYTTGTQNFTLPDNLTYYNLNVMPATGRYITMPNINMEVYNNFTSGDEGTTYLNSQNETTLTVDGDFTIEDGILQFQNGKKHNISVEGDVSIGETAIFEVAGNGTAVANSLTVAGSLTNNGTLTFLNGTTRYCDLTFTGNEDESFTGINVSATTTLNYLDIDKGSTQNSILLMDVAGTLNTLTNNWLTISNGTFRFAKDGGDIVLTDQNNTKFTIPETGCLSVNHENAVITIGNRTNDDCDLILNGKLEAMSGTINIGPSSMPVNSNNDIEYSATGEPAISIETDGVLNVNGQIRSNLLTTSGALIYNQTGGELIIWGSNNEETKAILSIHNTGSIFNMSDGTITIKTGGSNTYSDLYLRPEQSTVTGGTIIFDATGTGANQTDMQLDADISLYNLTVTGTTNFATLTLNVNPLVLKGSLTIDEDNTFVTNNLHVSIETDFTNSGTYTYGTNTTTFNGTGEQKATFNIETEFYNLDIDKSSGILTLYGDYEPRVNNDFSLEQGTFDTRVLNLYVTGDVENSGIHQSSQSGAIVLDGLTKQYISGDGTGSFANLTIDNTNGVYLSDPVSITKQLYFENGMFYLDENLLTFTRNGLEPSNTATNRFICTNGAASDGGVKKIFSSGYTGSFNFYIGSLASGVTKYTPVNYTLEDATGTSPSLTVRPINSQHLATTDDDNDTELKYYWSVEASDDFSVTALTHVYNYLDSDVQGTESDYIGGSLPTGTTSWLQNGTVDSDANTITFSNTSGITGDYTAGLATEFASIDTYYSRDATSGGDWNDGNSWSTNGHDGDAAGIYPQGSPAVIKEGHTITATEDGYSSINLELNGTLNIGATVNHNFVTLSGNGRLIIEPNGDGAFIFPGGDNTPFMNTTGSTIQYYSTGGSTISPVITTYQNIELAGAGDKTLANVNLTVLGNIYLLGGEFSNEGYDKDISLYKNWVNNTTYPYVPGKGTVYFEGNDAMQFIEGTITEEAFYNIEVNSTEGVILSTNITIANDLTINESAYLYGNTDELSIQGNWLNNSSGGFVTQTGTVIFNGTEAQSYNATSGETFYNLTIENPENVTAECNTTIGGTLDLTASGGTAKLIIDDNKFLFSTITANATNYGSDNYIQTGGDADDAGVYKTMGTTFDFTFPIGLEDKYTPVSFSGTASVGGTVSIIPVDDKHPYASNNITDELQYYWIVASEGNFTPSSVTHAYTFDEDDAMPATTDYNAARFHENQWSPEGGGEENTAVGTNTITFTGKDYIDGEYTAGKSRNFTLLETYYSRNNATDISTGADWRNLEIWSTVGHDDNLIINRPNTLPNCNSVIIGEDHVIANYEDGITLASLTLEENSELQINATVDHDFGNVAGQGTLVIKNTSGSEFVLPEGTYTSFVSSSGGTIEYQGGGNLPDELSTYNNLTLTGANAKYLADQNLVINGDLLIEEGELNNSDDVDIKIYGDWLDYSTATGPGSGKVTFAGSGTRTIDAPNGFKEFGSFICNSGADIDVSSLSMLAVNGSTTINSSMRLNSDASGTASFIDNGTITGTGTVTVERYLGPNAWHYISSPIANASNKLLTEDLYNPWYNSNLIYYNENYSGSDWDNGWEWSYLTPAEGNLEVPLGYGYYCGGSYSRTAEYEAPVTEMNTGEYTIDITNQDNTEVVTGTEVLCRGWNLVGNPYPSHINAEAFLAANSDLIDGAIYLWDEQGDSGFDEYGSDYAIWNMAGTISVGSTGTGSGSTIPNGIISSGQAFFVHKTETGSGTLTFNNDMRSRGETQANFYKNTSEIQRIKLAVSNSDNNYNEILLAITSKASDEYDAYYDALKFQGNDSMALYSMLDNRGYAIQTIAPLSSDNKIIPVGLLSLKTGKHTFTVPRSENLDVLVYLDDKELNTTICLNTDTRYEFDVATAGENEERFELRFKKNTPPEAIGKIANQTVLQDSELSLQLSSELFTDADTLDVLSYEALQSNGLDLPDWLEFDASEISFTGTPGNSDVGEYTIYIIVKDLADGSDYISFKIYVEDVNEAPVKTRSISDWYVTDGQYSELIIPDNIFHDPDIEDELVYTIEGTDDNELPDWLSIDSETQIISAYSEINRDTSITVTLIATDKGDESAYTNFTVYVENVNDAPKLENPISDITVYVNEAFTYIIPENTFVDPESNDTITYTASLSDGSELPDWLTFDSKTCTFEGLATEATVLEIQVTASDGIYQEFDTYTLTVLLTSNIETQAQTGISLFPNPVNDIMYITGARDYSITVRDNVGKILYSDTELGITAKIDFSAYNVGIYFIEFRNGQHQFVRKVVVVN